MQAWKIKNKKFNRKAGIWDGSTTLLKVSRMMPFSACDILALVHEIESFHGAYPHHHTTLRYIILFRGHSSRLLGKWEAVGQSAPTQDGTGYSRTDCSSPLNKQ